MVAVPSLLRIRETTAQILSDLSAAGLSQPLVVTGPTSGPLLGRAVAAALDEAIITEVASHSFEEVKRVVAACLDGETQTIVGVGGGRVVDVAKMAAHKLSLPFVSVPSQVSHDGVCSPVAVVRLEDGATRSAGARTPSAVFVARDVVLSAPGGALLAGLGDLFSNLSATKDWRLAEQEIGEPVDDYAFMLANLAASSVFHDDLVSGPRDGLLEPLIQGLVLSGIAMSIAGSSRPCSGAEHKISHALDELFPGRSKHGLQVALGVLYAEILRGDLNGLIPLLRWYRAAGLPCSHRDLGFTASEMIMALMHAPQTRPDRWTILEKVCLTRPQAEELVDRLAGLAQKFSTA